MRGLGRSFLEVGATFKHGEQWARRVVLQHCPVTGKPHIEASLGRPRKTSALEDCNILAMAKKERTIPSKDIRRAIRDAGGSSVTAQTVRNWLREWGGREVTAVDDDLTDAYKSARVLWCSNIGEILLAPQTSNFFKDVLFSDESMFTLDGGKVNVGLS